jgi:hypothetical protein
MFLKTPRFRFADKTVFYYGVIHALGPSTLRIRRLTTRKRGWRRFFRRLSAPWLPGRRSR